MSDLHTRIPTPSDFDFLRALYRQTCKGQSEPGFALSLSKIICYLDRDIGSISLLEHPEFFLLEYFALLPPYQKQGLGTQFMQELLEIADRKKVVICLKLQRDNPARRFYERLGFETLSSDLAPIWLKWESSY